MSSASEVTPVLGSDTLKSMSLRSSKTELTPLVTRSWPMARRTLLLYGLIGPLFVDAFFALFSLPHEDFVWLGAVMGVTFGISVIGLVLTLLYLGVSAVVGEGNSDFGKFAYRKALSDLVEEELWFSHAPSVYPYTPRYSLAWVKEPNFLDSWNPLRLVAPLTLAQAFVYDDDKGEYTVVTIRGSAFYTSTRVDKYLADRALFNETLGKLESNRKSGK